MPFPRMRARRKKSTYFPAFNAQAIANHLWWLNWRRLSFCTPQFHHVLEAFRRKAVLGAKLRLSSRSFGDDESLIAHMLTIALQTDTKILMRLQRWTMMTTMRRMKMLTPKRRMMNLKVCYFARVRDLSTSLSITPVFLPIASLNFLILKRSNCADQIMNRSRTSSEEAQDSSRIEGGTSCQARREGRQRRRA